MDFVGSARPVIAGLTGLVIATVVVIIFVIPGGA